MTCYVALVTDRAGSFVTLLRGSFPRLIEDGRIRVTTLGRFEGEREALAFLQRLRSINEKVRARTADDLEAFECHGLLLSPGQVTLRQPAADARVVRVVTGGSSNVGSLDPPVFAARADGLSPSGS